MVFFLTTCSVGVEAGVGERFGEIQSFGEGSKRCNVPEPDVVFDSDIIYSVEQQQHQAYSRN